MLSSTYMRPGYTCTILHLPFFSLRAMQSSLESAWSSMHLDLIAAGSSLLLYGFYFNLFLFSMYTLSRRWGSPGSYFLASTSCIMAVLCTAGVVTTAVRVIVDYRLVYGLSSAPTLPEPQSIQILQINATQRAIPTLNNLTTDFLYLYRCYVIWGYQKRILVLPATFMLATFAVGIWDVQDSSLQAQQIMFCLAVLTNLTLTTLTAGRILWIGRMTPHIIPDNTYRARCKRAINIILESGGLYCAGVGFLLITASIKSQMAYLVGVMLSVPIMNILPTFTIVYVAMTDAFDDSKEAKLMV
ncbi:hypothetical protein R3P38DRAFT_2936881 [Favolaschia claudopus]|uniref:Gustatory receptor n=1 Tax=Favolaschia claudopus TaxID=2862362 RepID=A0AAW0BPM8_9AGAR